MTLEERVLPISRVAVDDETRMRRAMVSLEKENRTLKELVVKLSATIVRYVADRKK